MDPITPNSDQDQPSAHISHTFVPHEPPTPTAGLQPEPHSFTPAETTVVNPNAPMLPPAPIPPVAPVYVPAAPQSTVPATDTPHDSPGSYVLQWLTYAFWGWTVLAMSILTSTVIASFVAGADTGDFTPYGIAAVLVLLPIAATCDYFYSKIEHPKKTGPASLIMIIHAVVFALFGIGSLIVAVFSTISLFLNSSSSDSAAGQVSLYSSLVIFILYAATFLRTLNPAKLPQIRRFFMIFMVITVGLVALLGIFGPMHRAHVGRDDKLVEDNLYSIQNAVDDYADANRSLPSSLSAVDPSTTDAKQLISRNLVRYTPNSKAATSVNSGLYSSGSSSSSLSSPKYTDTTLYYKLCVTFKNKDGNGYNKYIQTDSGGYTTYVSVYGHPAGDVCYSIKKTIYGSDSVTN